MAQNVVRLTFQEAARQVLGLARHAHLVDVQGVRGLATCLLMRAAAGDGEAGVLAAKLAVGFNLVLEVPNAA